MSLATTISAMVAAGCTPQQIEAVVISHEVEQKQRLADKRAKDAERQRKSRASRNVTVTERDSHEQGVTSPSLKDPQPELITVQVSPNPPPYSPPALEKPDLGFGEVWDAYPRRLGTNSRKNAETRYRAAVKSGCEPAAILDGVRRYAAQCDATGKTGTEFVKAAEAWLNGRLWECSYELTAPSRSPPPRQARRNTALDDLNDLTDRMFGNVQHFPRIAG